MFLINRCIMWSANLTSVVTSAQGLWHHMRGKTGVQGQFLFFFTTYVFHVCPEGWETTQEGNLRNLKFKLSYGQGFALGDG